MAKNTLPQFTLENIKPEHAKELERLSQKGPKYATILGSSYEENRKMAEAFSRSYPLASLIKDENSHPVGIVLVERAGDNNIEATVITERKDVFTAVLIETVTKYKGKYKCMFITPEFPDELIRVSFETRSKISREKDFLDGRKSEEFKILLS